MNIGNHGATRNTIGILDDILGSGKKYHSMNMTTKKQPIAKQAVPTITEMVLRIISLF
jgi:hypothetical protein